MKIIHAIAGLLLYTGASCGQPASAPSNTLVQTTQGNLVSLSSLGYTRIILKDGTAKKDCIIQEINENYIVYKKDRVLHDLQKDRIKRIELKDAYQAIYFEDKKAVLKPCAYER